MISFDSEKSLEDFICSSLDDGYNHITECNIERYTRQPNFSSYGKGDILVISQPDYNCFSVELYELKNETLKAAHVMQIARYRKFFMESDPNFDEEDYVFSIVCKKSDVYQGDLIFLVNQIDWLTVYEFSLDPESGISFDEIGSYTTVEKEEDRQKAYNSLGIVQTPKEIKSGE